VNELREYVPPADALAGKVIAVTGATGGLGAAIARAAAASGAEVILIARNARRLATLHESLVAAHGERALMAPLDLESAVAGQYDAIADAVMQRFGRLDGLVHCAGLLGKLTPIEQYDVPTWFKVMHVNVTAAFALTQVLMPALRAAPSASVLFSTSSVGRRGRAYWGAYAVSKFAIEGLTQVLADELDGTTRIRVNALNPGRLRTAMRRAAYPSEDLASLPEPHRVVGPYLALLGDAFPGITGRSLDCQPLPGESPGESPGASIDASSPASS
jgi:NAD(P)-dependent dehydrogenase (short-subunit alcohol dehydrogenase family)